MYQRLKNGTKEKRDWRLWLSIAVVIVLAVLLAAPLAYGARLMYRFHGFTASLAESFVYGENTGSLRAEYAGESWRPRDDQAGRLFTVIVQKQMGHPQKRQPEDGALSLTFGDGSSLQIWQAAITEAGRAADTGVLIWYTGTDGAVFAYDTDQLQLDAVLGYLGYPGGA